MRYVENNICIFVYIDMWYFIYVGFYMLAYNLWYVVVGMIVCGYWYYVDNGIEEYTILHITFTNCKIA